MVAEQDDFRIKTVEYIESAKKELAKLQEELKELEAKQRRVSDLQIAMDKAMSVAGIAPEIPNDSQPAPIASRVLIRRRKGTGEDIATRPIREKVHALILEFGRPMTIKEIAQEFYRREWKLSKEMGVESIRVMLWKHKDIFMKVGEKLYDVIK